MVLGNVFGSNILNILLILGISALIRPLTVHSNAVKKEIPICILVSALVVTLFLDVELDSGNINQISRADGITILLFFAVFLYYLISTALQSRNKGAVEKPKWKLPLSSLLTLLGLGGIVFGSNLVVENAQGIATAMGVSERVIALTIIAFGTSLPELVTSIVSARKGETELLIGNILGSNIFNICIVLGVPAAVFGGVIPQSFNYIDLVALLVSALVLFLLSFSHRRLSRKEGIAMLTLFAIYYTLVFVI
jgi:cation:H+ antiporter